MDTEITIGSETRKVRVERGPRPEAFLTYLDSQQKMLTVVQSGETLVISVENRVYLVEALRRTTSSLKFLMNGKEIIVPLSAHKGLQDEASKSSDVASVGETVASNFPAKVVEVRAARGSTLKEGDTIFVLEAMKMEAQVKVPMDCTVVDVYVKQGDMVARGTKLCVLKFAK